MSEHARKSKSCPIRPFGKERPRVTRGGRHTYMNPDYVAKKDTLKMMFGYVPEFETIHLTVTAVRAMPKSWSKKKRTKHDGVYCTTKPDLDNILGAVMDSLFPDSDSKVVCFDNCKKIWGNDDALIIVVSEAM